MYMHDKKRVETVLIGSILECLMLTNTKYNPDNTDFYKPYLEVLRKDISEYIKTDKQKKRLYRAEDKIINHFKVNEWDTRKANMIMSNVGNAVIGSEMFFIPEGIQSVIRDLNNVICEVLDTDEDIAKQDESAAKQTPKVLRLIQEAGYYQGFEVEVV